MSKNTYDKKDIVRRYSLLRAGPLKIACYTVRDPETGEHGPKQFHMTWGDTVMAILSEESAKLLVRIVRAELGDEADAPSPSTGG